MMLSKLVIETTETRSEQKSVVRLIDGWMVIRLDRGVVARLLDCDGRVTVALIYFDDNNVLFLQRHGPT